MTMFDDLDPREFEATARAAIQSCAAATDTAARARLLAKAGLVGILAPEEVGGLGLPIRFALPVVSAAGEGLLAWPLIENMLLAQHLVPVAPEIASALCAGESTASIAWSGYAGDDLVGGAPMAHAAAHMLVFLADGSAGLVQPGDRLRLMPGVGLDADMPDYTLALNGHNPRPVLDAEAVDALRADATLLRAAFIMGSAAQCLRLATDYTQERVQFGKPLSANQALRHRLSRDALAVETLRTGLARAVTAPAEGPVMACEAIWLAAAQIGPDVAESAIQLFGGMGFTWDIPLHRHLRQMQTLASQGAAVVGLDALAAGLLTDTGNEWYGDLANAG